MPKVVRFNCTGLDLTSPVDAMPDGGYPVLTDCRVQVEGRIEGRPGYIAVSPELNPKQLHSIRRLNDPALTYSSAGHTYAIGLGVDLYAGQLSSPGFITGGFSGDPLSLIPFRPENSPAAWMYVYDSNKQLKMRPDGVVRDIGVAPPRTPPTITYGEPAMVTLSNGESAVDWVVSGVTTAVTDTDRAASSSPTIGSILYDEGTSGWCCISPSLNGVTFWTGQRMRVVFDAGGAAEERVAIREIHPAINGTTVQSVMYDTANIGWCTVVLTDSPPNIARNSLLVIGSEIVKVESVTYSVDQLSYSIRVFSVGNLAVGAAVQGRISWYVYCNNTHAGGESIDIFYVAATQADKGTGAISTLYTRSGTVDTSGANIAWVSGDKFAFWEPGTLITINGVVYTIDGVTSDIAMLIVENAGVQAAVGYSVAELNAGLANGRPISAADDYMHCSVFLGNPTKVTELNLYVDVDSGTTSTGNAFTRNYWKWTFTQDDLNSFGPGNASQGSWIELLVPISQGVRYGGDRTRTFDTIKALKVEVVATAACNYGMDCWYFLGTYGPTIQPNSPVGMYYQSRYRDSTTGAASLPGPVSMYGLYPLREKVIVTAEATNAAGVDSVDLYRMGNAIVTMTYIGTVVNDYFSPIPFSDIQTDPVIALNPPPDLTLVQPWPVQAVPRSGVVSVVGTSVKWISGDKFDLNLIANTVILINGEAYQIYGNPVDDERLVINLSAGVQSNVDYVITAPVIAASKLSYVFGPLEGPFNPVIFGIGDDGLLYFTNAANADAASDANTLEITTPSEQLVSGVTWKGLVCVGSKDNVYFARYSYLQTQQDVTNNSTFQQANISSPSGFWSRWCVVAGPDAVYFLGQDGIYRATENGAVNITDAKLYPLFPHDGEAAKVVNGYYPVDMDNKDALRLSVCDQDLFFDYVDTQGNQRTLRYEIPKQRWFMHKYGDPIRFHYLVEGSVDYPANMEVLMLPTNLGKVLRVNGDIDGTHTLSPVLVTPSFSDGDDRLKKLYTDMVIDTDCGSAGAGGIGITLLYNNQAVTGPGTGAVPQLNREQVIRNIASLSNLESYRNVAFRVTWDGGPSAARLYEFIIYAYAQPYMSKRVVTQFIDLAFTGWKHHRRLFPGMISNHPIEFTIKCIDGRTFGPIIIPSTGGQFNIVTQMLPQDIKDLAFAYELDGGENQFALFPDSFTIETKEWTMPEFINLAVFKV